MRKKSQELLDNLNKITAKPKMTFEENVESYTNRHYPSTIHKLPTSYDKAKRYKDEEGEEYIGYCFVITDFWVFYKIWNGHGNKEN